MIVVRNSKEEQRKNQSAQPTASAAFMHPPVRGTMHSGMHQVGISAISREALLDGTRLSREASLGASFRNEGRFLNGSQIAHGIGGVSAASASNADIGRRNCLQQPRSYTHRSGLTPVPPQPTIWSNAGDHHNHHRYIRGTQTDWHNSNATAQPEVRRTSAQQLWPENGANILGAPLRPALTRVQTSIHNRPWEWSTHSTAVSHDEPRVIPEQRFSSQREWSSSSNWQANGNGAVSSTVRNGDNRVNCFVQSYSNKSESMARPSTPPNNARQELEIARKRLQGEVRPISGSAPSIKRSKGLDMLDLLCQATLDVGPMQDNPTGCSCPKSKCVALYCDCFKAGRRCDEKNCGCIDCKNTLAESGADGARTKAIRSILARNPRAFLTAGVSAAEKRAPPGEIACNCIRSRCLKLYCSCFQNGKTCTQSCTCVGCSNTDDDNDGERKLAVQLCLEKRPDAFQQRVREPGLGCACKNNRCVRKYCECFRSSLACTNKCTCRRCENRAPNDNENESL